MKHDAKKLATSEKAILRRLAVQRVLVGESQKAVTDSCGLGEKLFLNRLKWRETIV